MVDRRSSINYINEKYHGRRSTHLVAPAVNFSTVHHAVPEVVHVEETVVDVPVSQPAPIVDNRIHSKGFRICGCPWWLCLLLTLLALILLGVLIGFLTGFFGNRDAHQHPGVNTSTTTSTSETTGEVNGGTPETGCSPGFFAHNGKCITCPDGSSWNGENCVKVASHLTARRSA